MDLTKPLLIRLTEDILAMAGDCLLIEPGGSVRVVEQVDTVAVAGRALVPVGVSTSQPKYRNRGPRRNMADALPLFAKGGVKTPDQVATTLNLNPKTASGWCARLARDGHLVRITRGQYVLRAALANGEAH